MSIVRWGVLGTARIAVTKVLPAMRHSAISRVIAVASRDFAAAEAVRSTFDLARAYGSYDALLADGDVDAVYIALPNHLHVPWSIRALDAGKHVLCEKPIGLNAAEARTLADAAARRPDLKVAEALMYRHHPQWQRIRALVREGAIGPLRHVHTWFSYCNIDPNNVRNHANAGGGALMDIGCYGVSVAQFLFEDTPRRVFATSENDPRFGIDRFTSAVLECDGGFATLTSATQLSPRQHVDIVGTDGCIAVEWPFNPAADQPSAIDLLTLDARTPVVFDAANQFRLQADAFSRAILDDGPAPVALEESINAMAVIDAIRRSAADRDWAELPAISIAR